MAMTLRLDDSETAALRAQADIESRSMQDVARAAVREYVTRRGTARLIDDELHYVVTQYAEALKRLGEVVIRYLELDELLRIADRAVGQEVIVRDVGLLQSALGRPAASAFGQDAYAGLHQKAAALLHSLTANHALIDGNKRLAWAATAVFLGISGHRVTASQDEVVELVLAVADGTLRDVEKIAERLAAWSPGG